MSVVDALLQIFSRMGFPKEIQHDQGTSFMSELTTEFFERFGVRVVHSSTYHPQSNPVERFHRTLGRILRVLCSEEGPDWEKHVHAALFALRTVTHESTGFSPVELVHGRNLRTPVTLLYENWLQPEEEQTPVTEYVFTLLNRLKRFQDLAVKEMEKSQQRNKTWYDKRSVKREFQEGDSVLIFSNCRANKLSPRWTGPEAEEGIGVDELEIPRIEQTPNVLDLSEIIPEPIGSTLTEDQCQQLRNVIWKYRECFSNVPGKTDLVTHDIELVSDEPVMSKPYRTSPRQNEILRKEIQKMLSMKIIEVGYSDYTSPMILVEAPGKEPRPCVDYRNLNKITKTKFYPLPNIEERIETVSSAKYITVLDLSKGYWQIPMSKNAQRLSAFVTNFGTYIPLRMPFGLKNAPYEFSRMVAQLLEACEDFAVPYLDDIAVFSVMFQEHIKHLETVLQRIQQAGLTIKPSKCKFAQSQVQHLGHTVGQGCRRPSELKIEAVKNFPTPRTKTDIRAFLALAGYYSHYIPMFSTIAAPLTDALKGKCRKGVVHWTEDCEKAFNSLKQALASKPVLHSPDYNRQFILQTDASDNGRGVVLSQVTEDDKEHPIVYLSRKFSDVEKKILWHEETHLDKGESAIPRPCVIPPAIFIDLIRRYSIIMPYATPLHTLSFL
ncbi:Retrovirus-related Pol polyprotein from transposon 17.6 [Araneus ventricosus]|uniref:RNA-directed DNA polymerase n=1 Tax=Araneus ventricosus TaxID=182803 RepID=A0A4Y2AV56_ARAVE|nr:Retrovirus-related Pol polyprotein from transposon 17.6 [Araneus ventricosus]